MCTSNADLSGKTVIITGATSGIGYFTALDLAMRNARVILACRNTDKGEDAARRIKEETGNENLVVYELDVSSMKSIRKFLQQISLEEERCDILINNAGVTGIVSKMITDEGLEYMYATNYFGPFLLTNLLIDLLKRSTPSRIVNVSSIAHIWGTVELDNLNSEQSYSTGQVYFGSKLALVIFTRELAKRLEGTGVTANSLHPGTVRTDLLRHLPAYLRLPLNAIGAIFFKSPEEGAQTLIHCSVSRSIDDVTGRYFSECAIAEESKRALDDNLALELWKKSEKITSFKSTI